jgi:hypothetical protein
VKTIRDPTEEINKRFAKQEACRKDVERAFDALQPRWAIARHPARTWSHHTMWEVMRACVIMHNMIVEDEHDEELHDQGWQFQGELVEPQPGPSLWDEFIAVHHEIRDRHTHNQLHADLIEHQWALAGIE